MIIAKFVLIAIAAGVFVSLFTPNFDADLVLAIVSCFT